MESEEEEWEKNYLQSIREREIEELDKNADIIERFKFFCAKKGLHLTDQNFRYVHTIGVVALYPNILSNLNSKILRDKEGLVNHTQLMSYYADKGVSGGYLWDPNYVILAHPFFRRGYCEDANYAPRFLDLFWGLTNPDIELFISLDFDRIRINVDESTYIERDTWYGAKFNKDIALMDDCISKIRPPLDMTKHHIKFFFNNAYSLDTIWSTKNGIKTFQAEEFKNDDVTIEINGNSFYPVRYIHSEYDIELGYFRHFDGAIHLYNSIEYFQRRDSDFNYNSKNSLKIKSNSTKLFKMNGLVDIDTFILFTSHFFSGNPLILEYFEGDYPDYLKEIIDKIRLVRDNQK